MSYAKIVFGCIAALAVVAATAATESPTKVPGTGSPAPGASSSTKPAAAQTPAASTMAPEHGSRPAKKMPVAPEKLVDVNNASVADLKKDLAIGDDVAQKIIAARPLTSKTDLITKAGLPEGVYLSLRHKIAINTMKPSPSKNPAPKKASSVKPEPKQPESKTSATKQ